MIVILKRLSETTKTSDIERFLAPELIGSLFKKTGWIESLTIQKIETSNLKEAEYHAVVDIQPESAAKRLVKSLNRKLCHGKRINVAQYYLRYKLKDQRTHKQANSQVNLRKGDRRRSNLLVSDITKQRKNANGRDNLIGTYNKLSSNPFDNTFKI